MFVCLLPYDTPYSKDKHAGMHLKSAVQESNDFLEANYIWRAERYTDVTRN